MRIPFSKTSDFWETYYFVIGLLGLILIILEIDIYRVTIIKKSIPLAIILIAGLLAFILNWSRYRKTYPTTGFLLHLAQSIISWGFIAAYVFMATNYYFASTTITDSTYPIKSKSSMSAGRRTNNRDPTVKIDYDGFEKELVFKPLATEDVNAADSVKMKIRTGYLGFDVIQSYEVLVKR